MWSMFQYECVMNDSRNIYNFIICELNQAGRELLWNFIAQDAVRHLAATYVNAGEAKWVHQSLFLFPHTCPLCPPPSFSVGRGPKIIDQVWGVLLLKRQFEASIQMILCIYLKSVDCGACFHDNDDGNDDEQKMLLAKSFWDERLSSLQAKKYKIQF